MDAAKGFEMARRDRQLGPAGKVAVSVLAIVQALFAFLAFWDLAHRRADAVKGRKPVWIPVILVNWVGPASYFLFGIKR